MLPMYRAVILLVEQDECSYLASLALEVLYAALRLPVSSLWMVMFGSSSCLGVNSTLLPDDPRRQFELSL